MDSHHLYLAHRDTLEHAIAAICRRFRLPAADAEDFASDFRLRLVEEDYATLKQFQGRSSLSTYLHVVVMRAYQDWRNARWGKWRPSAEARRLGPVALRLETLVVRDRHTLDEAGEILRTNMGLDASRASLEAMAARFPPRQGRVFVADDALDAHASVGGRPDEDVDRSAATSAAASAQRALGRVVAKLPPEDRLILRMRFDDCVSVADIGRALHLEQKPLYRRIDRLLADLRAALAAEGLTAAVAAEVLVQGGFDTPTDIIFATPMGNRETTSVLSDEHSGRSSQGGEGV